MRGIWVELMPEAQNATDAELRPDIPFLRRHLDERLSDLGRGERGTLGGNGVPR